MLGGIFLMLEGSKQGLNKLNSIRSNMGLETINVAWHNVFFNDDLFLDFSSDLFENIKINNFSSIFMLISRVLYPKLIEPDEPKYNEKINEIASSLPNCGDFGYLKLFVFKRNHNIC